MNTTFSDTIREHSIKEAQKTPPEEACGLIFRFSGQFVVRPEKNVYTPEIEREKAFQIDPKIVSEALKTGALVGVYHSHINDLETHGEQDKAVAEEYDAVIRELNPEAPHFASYVYHVPTDKFCIYYATGIRPPLIGRPYIPMLYSCVSVIRDYFREKHGIDSPDFTYAPEECKSGKEFGIDEYFTSLGFERVTGPLRVNDVVLMMIHSRFPNHCGVLTEDFQMLHHLAGKESKLDPYGGTWLHLTCQRYRHPRFK